LPLTNSTQRFEHLQEIWLGTDAAHVVAKRILKARIDAKQVVLQLDGMNSVEEAESIKDWYVFVAKDHAVRPEAGSYFIDEVIGCRVVTEDQTEIGTVTDLLSLPMNDIWVVNQGEKEILIPAVKAVIRQVDVEQKRIVIQAVDGLLD